MDFGVRKVFELLWNERARVLLFEFESLFDCALHALRAVGEDELRAETEQEFSALYTHRFGHGENELVALDRRDERKTDTRVAAGRLNNQTAFFEQTFFLGVLDHGESRPVLNGAGGVEKFELGKNLGFRIVEFVESDKGSPADKFKNVVCNFHVSTFFVF